MKKIKHAGELLKITEPQYRILTMLQCFGHVAQLSDFKDYGGVYREDLLKGEDPDDLKKLGVHICSLEQIKYWDNHSSPSFHKRAHKFFADNPRCKYGVFSDKRKVNQLVKKLDHHAIINDPITGFEFEAEDMDLRGFYK